MFGLGHQELIIIAGAIVVYLLPGLIAFARGHRNAIAITALNILLGWSFFGWIGAFVWSLTNPACERQ